MASANTEITLSNLNLVDLDYYSIKTSLKNFLKEQAQFKDYNYDGPNMATLLRLLSYNTYINAFYTNMAIAEAHLDSAQLRSSILSHAKDLNYLPRSIRSSRARVRVDFEATSQNQPYTVSKGSTFSAVVKSTVYTFSIPETIVVASANNTFSFETDIYEGFFVKDSYVFTGVDNERFRITNRNIDTRTLTVTVYEDEDTIGQVYIYQRTLLDIDAKSKVFFLQSAEDGFFDVLFGDDILGRSPKIGATVVLDYRISSGPEADGAALFGLDFDPTGESQELNETPDVTTIEDAKGGLNAESNESVRYYAPRAFQVQERTVIAQDYTVALKQAFPEINTMIAFGGEELNPPRMSKVVLAVDITNVDGLPDSKIDEYTRFLKRRSPFAIDPIFQEPEYLFVEISTLVRFNANITTNSRSRIGTLVTNAIVAYNDVNLNDFGVTLRESALCRTIDFADVSIISNITDIRMYKKLENVTLGVPKNYVIDYNVPIRDTLPVVGTSHRIGREHSVKSSSFIFSGVDAWLEDDGIGGMRVVRQAANIHLEIVKAGTVDYVSGRVNLDALQIDDYEGASVRLYAFPKDKDITAAKASIMQIESAEIKVTVEELRE